MRTLVPFRWFGGKARKVHFILPHFPPHYTYVEPFGGAAALLLAKPPSPVEVYNDLDEGLVTFFRVLRNPNQFRELARLLRLTPYSREEYQQAARTLRETSWTDDVSRAWCFFIAAQQSFSGVLFGGWSRSVKTSRRGMAKCTSDWHTAISRLTLVRHRLAQVQIEHSDFRQIISAFDTPDTLFYCDPPYVTGTRKGGKYLLEMSDNDHRDLVRLLLQIKGKALVSGYAHPIYTPLEEGGWRRVDFPARCQVAGRTRASAKALTSQARTESLWISPNCEEE